MADPTPPSAPPMNLTPIIGPVLTMLGTRKGFVVLGAIVFCSVVYFREPARLSQLLTFLAVLLPSYFGAQAYEDNGKAKAKATVDAAAVAAPAGPVTTNVTNVDAGGSK